MRLLKLAAALTISIVPCTVNSLSLDSIDKCPSIPKYEPATSVTKLRPGDIKVVATMGDSVSAGLLEKNVDSDYINYSDFIEYRGSSFTAGGDPGAITVPNFLKHYSPDLYGASMGQRPARLCLNSTFFCFDSFHKPEIDHLNAAQSGATSLELPEQVDYLLESLGPGTPLAKEWKMINVFIGYNDATAFCFPGRNSSFYEEHVYMAVKKLISTVEKSFVNLVGLNSFSKVIETPLKEKGYLKHFKDQDINLRFFECNCCTRDGYTTDQLGRSSRSIDLGMQRVHSRLKQEGFENNNVVVYQPLHLIDTSIPYYAQSNVDGFHPNTNGHAFLAKVLWKNLFETERQKYQSVAFDLNYPIYCPTGNDTFKIN